MNDTSCSHCGAFFYSKIGKEGIFIDGVPFCSKCLRDMGYVYLGITKEGLPGVGTWKPPSVIKKLDPVIRNEN